MKKKRLYESNIFKYDFSGDRYVDWVLSYWFDWYSDSAGLDVDLTDEQVYEMFVNQGFDKLAEIIFEEFPICATTPHCDFDAEYCWEKFLDTREGRKAEKWLEDNVTVVIDNAIVNEYLDDDLIAESIDSYWVDEFLKTDKNAKLLKKADREKIRTALIEGVPCDDLSNGFSFVPSEYAEVINIVGDDENTTVADLKNLMGSQSRRLKQGDILVHTSTYNPHLYNGMDIDFVYRIDIGKIIEDALVDYPITNKKGKEPDIPQF